MRVNILKNSSKALLFLQCWLDLKKTVKTRVDAMTPKERIHNLGSLDCLLFSEDLYTALIKVRTIFLSKAAFVSVFFPHTNAEVYFSFSSRRASAWVTSVLKYGVLERVSIQFIFKNSCFGYLVAVFLSLIAIFRRLHTGVGVFCPTAEPVKNRATEE